jgi:hypothetical protein
VGRTVFAEGSFAVRWWAFVCLLGYGLADVARRIPAAVLWVAQTVGWAENPSDYEDQWIDQ